MYTVYSDLTHNLLYAQWMEGGVLGIIKQSALYLVEEVSTSRGVIALSLALDVVVVTARV